MTHDAHQKIIMTHDAHQMFMTHDAHQKVIMTHDAQQEVIMTHDAQQEVIMTQCTLSRRLGVPALEEDMLSRSKNRNTKGSQTFYQ